jgi:preprotein translocase subunit SecD
MKRSWWYKFSFLIILTGLSLFILVPTFFDVGTNERFPFKSKINLGLDLQGGLYMVLGIDFNLVYKEEIKTYSRKIESILNDDGIEAKIGNLDDSDVTDPRHSIKLEDVSQLERAKKKIKDFFPSILRLSGEEENILSFGLTKVEKSRIEKQSVTKSIEVIRNRIDEFGVTEPEILSQGKDRIIAVLPGVKDIERAKSLIGKTAKLVFKMVNDEIPLSTLNKWVEKSESSGIVYKKGDRFSTYLGKVNKFLIKDLPEGYELAFEKKLSSGGDSEIETKIPYLVETTPRLSGEALQDARVQINPQKNQPFVSLDFKSAGAKIFEEITGENVGKRMAIILDGNVYSAPNILSRIGGGKAQITLGGGNYNKLLKEAHDLALVLRAGALPVQLDFLEQRTVGPSLGQDSIMTARYAAIIGCILVFVFILVYYKVAGAIAICTLTLNIIFVLGCMVAFEATLTLPGIAGIALTVGMAVDANIIIYERIREEIQKGLGFYKALESGFNHAFLTIIDANITTALAGICLFNFGTGPIKGFAVTLLIGIVATVYTSYFIGKLFFEFYMNKVEGEELNI